MQKSDIKNGMHVITNNGEEWVILSNIYAPSQIRGNNTAKTIMANIDGEGWMNFDKYTSDLRCHSDNFDYEIQAVFEPQHYYAILMSVRNVASASFFKKIWERPIAKKMTKAEIEKELGYEIEIID